MKEFDDNEIATLLRLKRHEQPPPGYFENFLHEFHRRRKVSKPFPSKKYRAKRVRGDKKQPIGGQDRQSSV
jgi:hypothetical protein